LAVLRRLLSCWNCHTTLARNTKYFNEWTTKMEWEIRDKSRWLHGGVCCCTATACQQLPSPSYELSNDTSSLVDTFFQELEWAGRYKAKMKKLYFPPDLLLYQNFHLPLRGPLLAASVNKLSSLPLRRNLSSSENCHCSNYSLLVVKPVQLIHSKSMQFVMAGVICCFTEFKWATPAIVDSIRVTAVPAFSTSKKDKRETALCHCSRWDIWRHCLTVWKCHSLNIWGRQ
jgi:hypothetical protein